MPSAIDLVLMIAFAWGVWQGYRKGLIVELAGMFVLVLSLYFGLKGMNWAAGMLAEIWGIEGIWLPLLGFLVIFIGSMILVKVVASLMEKMVRSLLPDWISQGFGGLIGAARWVFWVSLLLYVITAAGILPQQARDESRFYRSSQLYAQSVMGVMKSAFGDVGRLFTNEATSSKPI